MKFRACSRTNAKLEFWGGLGQGGVCCVQDPGHPLSTHALVSPGIFCRGVCVCVCACVRARARLSS